MIIKVKKLIFYAYMGPENEYFMLILVEKQMFLTFWG